MPVRLFRRTWSVWIWISHICRVLVSDSTASSNPWAFSSVRSPFLDLEFYLAARVHIHERVHFFNYQLKRLPVINYRIRATSKQVYHTVFARIFLSFSILFCFLRLFLSLLFVCLLHCNFFTISSIIQPRLEEDIRLKNYTQACVFQLILSTNHRSDHWPLKMCSDEKYTSWRIKMQSLRRNNLFRESCMNEREKNWRFLSFFFSQQPLARIWVSHMGFAN